MIDSVKTILFVDDEAYIRQSFADFFEDNFWRTMQAESGEEALKLLEKESPDCAVVDIRMGGMDGNAFIREAVKFKTKMGFVVCTGSPEYIISADLVDMPCVSNILFKKPVTDMAALENEVLRVIDTLVIGF